MVPPTDGPTSWKDLAGALGTILVIVAVGHVVLQAQLAAIDKVRFQECRDHFNSSEFRNTTVDGSFACVKDGQVYQPELVLQGQTTNPLHVLFKPVHIFLEGIWLSLTSGSILERLVKNALLIGGVFWLFSKVRAP